MVCRGHKSQEIAKKTFLAVTFLLVLFIIFPSKPDSTQAALNITYLPFIISQESQASLTCPLNSEEKQIAQRMIQNSEQGRLSMTCHPILSQVAREKAIDMVQRDYFAHTNPDGEGPNYLVRQAGYSLPDYYSQDKAGNNIESIAGGYLTVEAVWNGWMSSPGHREHILGLHPFFAEQIEYGIGYYVHPNDPYNVAWVVITAK